MIKITIVPVLCAIFLSFPVIRCSNPEQPSQKNIAGYDSVYNKKVIVTDTGNIRDMIFHSSDSEYTHGTIDLKDPARLISSFMKCMMVPLTFFDRDTQEELKVLIIGLGAGAIPRYLRKQYPRMHIDAVEIDPVVVSVARKYFHVQEDPRYKIFTDDGRVFLEKTKKRYDIIFLDAYGPGDGGISKVEDLPKQLATIEFFGLVKSRLADNGILVSNYIFVNQRHYSSFHLSQKKNFPLIYRFPVKYSNETCDYNTILVAHKKAVPGFDKNYLLKSISNLKNTVKSDLALGDFMVYFNNDRVDEGTSVVELHDE
ncbi:MAG TPA: fused MFS/spermidine synthase [Spirochaetota bacterium]|nr:fused MFS/spermidine synthase [Spirochaetota bacterium]